MSEPIPSESASPSTIEPARAGRALVRGTAIVSIITQLSRILGFVREALTARLLGDGFFADAYFIAARIPNLLRSIFAEGALTSAFVPLFSTALEKQREAAIIALKVTTGFIVQITSALTLLGIWYAETIVRFFAPGFSPDKVAYCASLTKIMLPFIIVMSLVSLMNGALNSVKVFGTSAWTQVVINCVLILGAGAGFFVDHALIGSILSWSVIIGGIIGILVQIPALHRAGFSLTPIFSLTHPYIKNLILLMIPAVFGAALYQITIFIGSVFASLLPEGAVSSLYYADRVAQLPIGIFTVALGTVLLPTLSRAHAQKNAHQFLESLSDALRYTSFLMIPLAAFLFYFAQPLIALFLEGGNFTPESTKAASAALQAMSIGLWAVSCHSLSLKAFLARKDTLTPTLLSALSLCAYVVFSLLLMGSISSLSSGSLASMVRICQEKLSLSLPSLSLGHVGLALASSLSSCLSFICIGGLLTLRYGFNEWRSFLLITVRSLISVSLAFFFIDRYGGTLHSPLSILIIEGSIYFVLVVALLYALRTKELFEIISFVRYKLSQRKPPHR